MLTVPDARVADSGAYYCSASFTDGTNSTSSNESIVNITGMCSHHMSHPFPLISLLCVYKHVCVSMCLPFYVILYCTYCITYIVAFQSICIYICIVVYIIATLCMHVILYLYA